MKGVASAPEPEAVDAAVEVLAAGGNAVDAAVACALVQGVVDPPMCGIGGWGTLQVFAPGHDAHTCLDFYATAPAASRPDQWADKLQGETRDGWGFIVENNENEIGWNAVATPGTMAGLGEAHARYGRMPWGELLQPAIGYARRGFPVRPHLFDFLLDEGAQGRAAPRDKMRFSDTGRSLYYRPDGSALPVGSIVRNPDMADTLDRLARHGVETFYRGDLARDMAAEFERQGARMAFEDFANYRVVERDPVRTSYRGLDLATNFPPGGGFVLALMLGILERFDLAGLGHNSADYIDLISAAIRYATAQKDGRLGDPDFFAIDPALFLSPEVHDDIATRLRGGEDFSVERLEKETPNTTHLSIMDESGMAISMTHSLGMVSGATVPGMGFMFNGAMGVFDPRPGRAGSIAPGKRRYTSACPTMVFRDGRPSIVIGAPGGAHIAGSVMQALVNMIDFGMTAQEAVSAPRISATSNAIDIVNRIPRSVQHALEGRGRTIVRNAKSYAFAQVHAVVQHADGHWSGGADPASDGMVLTA
ncbi:gamma-glutamyltransferase [Pseudooceanicola sp. 216_PA32_1]|uniref:Gamma-glutamyltransferase n=1 Tax=Pseudooceanicola pacificus TaxID=2676438 RepID=A0A844WCF1_9RHOB|nr:gamma-glutamyltransferase family protein [Pseudooceanicola pacificus]MWB78668.1 gamma-glutamyltransferase [Pseudooceanicola pacificus]